MTFSSSRHLKSLASFVIALVAITMLTIGIISAENVSQISSQCTPSDLPFAVVKVAEHLITLLFS